MQTTKDKATPRPWKTNQNQSFRDTVVTYNHERICRCVRTDVGFDESYENAKLICEAVNQFEALNAVVAAAFEAKEGGYSEALHDKLCETLAALEAIRKEG